MTSIENFPAEPLHKWPRPFLWKRQAFYVGLDSLIKLSFPKDLYRRQFSVRPHNELQFSFRKKKKHGFNVLKRNLIFWSHNLSQRKRADSLIKEHGLLQSKRTPMSRA